MEGEITWRIDSYFEFLAEANADHDGQGVVCGLGVIGLHLDTQQFYPQKQHSHKQGGARSSARSSGKSLRYHADHLRRAPSHNHRLIDGSAIAAGGSFSKTFTAVSLSLRLARR